LVVGELEVLAQMLERIPHHFVMHLRAMMGVFMLAGFPGLKKSEPAERYRHGGHESDKFSCHCLVCCLFFGANRAPLSGMDDRQTRATVTGLLQKFSRSENHPKSFVTSGPSRLSSFLVWTGFALHG
jgi:hypothetical protein